MKNNNLSFFSSPRTQIKVFQWVGTIFAVIGMLISLYFLNKINVKALDQSKQVLLALGYAIMGYMFWKTIISAIIILRFVKKSTDEELVANRYILASLSLNLGGFLTPWVLTSLPNVTTQSTIKPKWFLSRSFAIITTIGSAIFLGILFWQLKTIEPNTNWFDQTKEWYWILVGFIIGNGVLLVVGLLAFVLFFNKNSKERFKGNTFTSFLMKTIAVFYLVIVTVELILLMIYSILRLIGNILNTARRVLQADNMFIGALYLLFGLLSTFFQIYYVIFLTIMISQTIKGIWRKDGVITIKVYDKIQDNKNKYDLR
ncbi:hypothetical protein V2P57_03400 [Mycoplasma mycoides subsp. mycoides]|uniref:Membrane protein n=1 Tax=Mycoplasma mycoides subsp. mycoides TaxID=2103 RepID=A0AAE2JSV0_MYCMY|nr:hypothetical protein [Mycoplasma mycoides]AMK56440.1 hypothetical protein MSCT144_05360 [Mycoplasma mycoides subsp. mycoides]KJQ45753.1 putative membrane protein [Mycoplasma mycoides subsp. mycoides]KJQ46971.1 putative membrane protein [Mycoplasma mycoides subsp. mycoides]PTD34285.1 putative transmembrane protein [Mycoplasma mycoides subsp. mycoides KH3J]PTD34346.1 putative transmembrane protein [Mycoplasma mycoides subsp. mycoides str. Gemu Goffa]